MKVTYNGQDLSHTYKVTRYVQELNMPITTNTESKLPFKDYIRNVNKPPKGLRNPLSEAIRVEDIETGEVVNL